MRVVSFSIVSLLFLFGSVFGQKFNLSYVMIPDDSTSPSSLTFFDSLHGYLGATRSTNDSSEFHYYETTDGGLSWNKITDTLISMVSPVFSVGAGYLHHNSPIVYANLASRYSYSAWYTGYSELCYRPVHSTDFGKTWQGKTVPIADDSYYYPLQAFDPYNLVAFNEDSGIIYQTTNRGQSYSRLADSTYLYSLYHIQRDSNYRDYNQYSPAWGQSISFDNSDRFHWAVAVNRLGEQKLNPPLHPQSMQMLLSENFGHTWKEYLTDIPGQDTFGRTAGSLQFIKGTPNLYYFTGDHSEGSFGYRKNGAVVLEYGDAMNGINWMYSTDYGKTWDIYRQYGDRRRGFEAVKQGEVWLTVRPEYSKKLNDPATVIAHTTDNGITWTEDSTTFRNDGIWDGRIITFSDPRHGWIAATDKSGLYGRRTFIFSYVAPAINSTEGIITESNQIYLKIYPNPSQYSVHLQLPLSKPIQKVEFYNLLGIRENPPYEISGSIATVDVKSLPIGTYIVRVGYLYKGYEGTFTLPLIVQH